MILHSCVVCPRGRLDSADILNTSILFCLPSPASDLSSFSEKYETNILKKLSRSIFLEFLFALVDQSSQDSLLNMKRLDQDQEIEHF